MKRLIMIALILASFNYTQAVSNESQTIFNISIPSTGNSWIMSNETYITSDIITTEGIRNWNNQEETIRTFFYMEKPGLISLGIKTKVRTGKSKINVVCNNEAKTITISNKEIDDIYIGDFQIEKTGYYFVDIIGMKKEDIVFADIDAILLKVEDPDIVKYIKDDFYFGRRGPSDHLNFKIPEGIDNIEWFYSEILIPEGQDVIGSYFMANGFGEGYFGIQVNSSTERRILFSIWSPYKTDNPNEVPEEYKIKLIKKGEEVSTGKFGNEGSGGQSYKVFNWNAEVSYGFLIGAKPTKDGSTDYIAYFFDPELNKWNLIAQFKRPKTTTYLTHLYSFLENFIPHQGVYERRGLYQNQWVYNSSGWHEIINATYTADNTARKEYRLDYSGGNEGNGFYLKNCGFTNDHTKIGATFQRKPLNNKPKVDFDKIKYFEE